jgi:cell division septation protein DedD
MSYPHDDHHDDTLGGKDHELTLSTAAIFGIFFGLVLLCGIFFGFGYSFGSHRSAYTLPSESASASTPANFGAFIKPAPGQPAGTKPTTPASSASAAPKDTPADDPAPPSNEDVPTPSAAHEAAPVVRVAPTPAAHPATTPAPAAAPPAVTFQVQVAAISINHPDDANLLMNALKAKGYAISAHPGPDNFIHLLIGPFTNRAAAESTRQRLLTDGYTAYIK